MNRFPSRPLVLLSILMVGLLSACGYRAASAASKEGGEQANKQSATKSGQVRISAVEQKAQHIEVEAAALGNESHVLRVAGRMVIPDDASWRVGVLVEGRIESVSANPGDFVHKGQILARMHSHEVHEAWAAYHTAATEIVRLDAAQSLAQRNYDRAQRLLALKAAAVQEVEQAKQDLINAQSAVANAKIAVERERFHIEDTLGLSIDSGSSSAGGDPELIPILSPAEGYILQKNVTPGSTIQPSTDAFVIGALQRLWMLASVTEDKLPQLHIGQAATIVLEDNLGQTFSGRVTNLGQQSDAATRLVPVRIDVPNTNNRLRPEMLATAEIAVGPEVRTLLVPQDSIQQVNGADVVFVQCGSDCFEVRPVRKGEIFGSRVRIVEGLRSGDRVVARGSFVVKSQLLKSSFPSE